MDAKTPSEQLTQPTTGKGQHGSPESNTNGAYCIVARTHVTQHFEDAHVKLNHFAFMALLVGLLTSCTGDKDSHDTSDLDSGVSSDTSSANTSNPDARPSDTNTANRDTDTLDADTPNLDVGPSDTNAADHDTDTLDADTSEPDSRISDTSTLDTDDIDTSTLDTGIPDLDADDSNATHQALWDEIITFADIYYMSWDTYQEDDESYDIPALHGDGVGSWRPHGPGVTLNSDLVWEVSEADQPDVPEGFQWWAPSGSGITRSLFYDRGDWDRYVHIPNGFPQRWQSHPGWTDLEDTHDFVYIFRRMPGSVFETLFNSVKIFDRGRVAYYIPPSSYPDVVRTDSDSPEYGDLHAGEYVASRDNLAPRDGEDAILRIQRNFETGQIRVWINEQRVIDFIATPGIDFKNEFTLGT
ncbi:MAG: hypothetical protein AAFX99_20740, partial [Myxococcota bacterium]